MDLKIGNIIKQRREELGLTQAQLCDGLCNQKTISRIENNTTQPSGYVIENLFLRLHIPKNLYYDLLSINNYEIAKLKKDIIIANRDKNFNKVNSLIEQIKKYKESEEPYLKQFILRSEIISKHKIISLEEEIKLLKEAIDYTIPNFDIDNFEDKFLNLEESKIILTIANRYCELGENERAINILKSLLLKNEKLIDINEESVALVVLIIYSLSQELSIKEDYYNALSITEKGISILTKFNKATHLGDLLLNKGYCMFKLDKRDDALSLYKKSILIFDIFNLESKKSFALKEAKELLGINIEL